MAMKILFVSLGCDKNRVIFWNTQDARKKAIAGP